MKLLIREGPKHGYYPEPDKSYLVVSPTFVELAKKMFSAHGVTIIEGGRVLGGFVGSKAEAQSWGSNKVQSWVKSLKILSEVARKQPQAAYVAVSKSLQNEWNYMQRIFPDCEDLFSPLKQSLLEDFFPSLTSNPISDLEFNIFEKPTRMAGFGIRDPVTSSSYSFETSRSATQILSISMINGTLVDIASYENNLNEVVKERKKIKDEKEKFDTEDARKQTSKDQ